MSDFCRVTLTADPMSRTGAAELLAWLGRIPSGACGEAAADARAISIRATPGGLELCGPTTAIEALLAELRPLLDQLGIIVSEPAWACDPGLVNAIGPHAGEPISLH